VLDVIVRGGLVMDGSGDHAVRADVGVLDGRVVAVEPDLDEPARRVVEADGLCVAPGFIDVHTHLDAQFFWDPLVSPSSNHGFTTVIGGNCGFTFAPVDETEADYLMRLMSVVEGIPLETIRAAVPFEWRTFGEYLGRLDGRVGVNTGFLVGHSALRRGVMGERANSDEASNADLGAMVRLLHESIAQGGLGFSSSWTTVHIDDAARPAPSRLATRDELVALAEAVGEHPGTTLEFAPGMVFGARETDAMIAMSLAANRPINWNVIQVRTPDRELLEQRLAPSDQAEARGARVVALTFPDATVSWHSMRSGMLYDNLPGWADIMHAPVSDRMRLLHDPDVRRQLEDGATHANSPFLRLLASWDRQMVFATYSPQNAGLEGRRIADIARGRGVSPFDAFLDIVLADELRTYVELPCEDDGDELWRMRVDLWRDRRTLIGGSDAGAHLDTLASQRYPTAVLGKAVRDRQLLSLEEAVAMLTSAPAQLYGLRDRGRLAPDYAADIVLFDPERVGYRPMVARHDLPGGAMRIYVEPEGIARVIVNGVDILVDDRPTGATPGTVFRSSDLDTVTLG
jgi:N-acyl-D-aspartate/D-glutamate deacylase